uniref:zinc finger CCCH domain-containing protein 7A n=1 Tax=Myxine glutinosa TaxID=7769 RepID=UPI00358F7E37
MAAMDSLMSDRQRSIKEGLAFLSSPVPFEGTEEQYEAFMRHLLSLLWREADFLYCGDQPLQALSQYQEALQLLDYMASEDIVCPSSVNEKLHANRAACYLHLNNPTEVLGEATEALQKNSRNVRALYRKAWALSALQNHKEAYDNIVGCALLLPQDTSVVQLMHEVSQKLGKRMRKTYHSTQAQMKTGIPATVVNDIESEFSEDCTDNARKDFFPNSGIPFVEKIRSVAAEEYHMTKAPGSSPSPMSIVSPISETWQPQGFNPIASAFIGVNLFQGGRMHAGDQIIDHEVDTLLDVVDAPFINNSSQAPVGSGRMNSLDDFSTSMPKPAVFNWPKSARSQQSQLPAAVPVLQMQAQPTGTTHSEAAVAASTENQGAVTGMANLALLSRNPLAETHEFRQACPVCFFKTGPRFNYNSFYPNLDHVCRKDVLISRLRNASKEGWKRIRPRPNVNYLGPYYMCKEVAEGVDCSYPGRCTFAYCQEEIDVWTLERKGIFHRDHLFDTGPSKPRITLAQILAEHRGGYLFLCLECFNCKPRTLSKRNPDSPIYCSTPNVRHIFDENKCLVHVEQGATIKYCKIRPLTEHTQLDLCQARYGCAWHDSCNYAHSLVELKTWVLQLETGMQVDSIEAASQFLLLQSYSAKMRLEQVSSDVIKTPRLYHQLKFVCSDCWRSGLATGPDPKRKYCESKARHLWSIKKCVLLASSPERKRWMPIRTLPATKIQPAQYEMCAHVANGKKCQYIGNCTFAHSQEEKEIWMYMKENKVNDMEKLYQLWIQKQDAKAAASKTNMVQNNSFAATPADYTDITTGFHCWLCGKNCNSEKQWEQHIQSEKHKDRIFLEDDTQTWQFRFPAGEFYLCNWTKGGHDCPEGDKCQYAHSEPELREWEERRVFLRQKFEKAVEDKLILPSDNFSKYNFLLK